MIVHDFDTINMMMMMMKVDEQTDQSASLVVMSLYHGFQVLLINVHKLFRLGVREHHAAHASSPCPLLLHARRRPVVRHATRQRRPVYW